MAPHAFLHTPRGHSTRPAAVAAAAVILVGLATMFPVMMASAAHPTVELGGATSFGVAAGEAITNTGDSVVSGDVGVSPGTAVTGFPPGRVVNGTIHRTDAVAAEAQAALTRAYDDASGRTPVTDLPADLGGLILTDGVYADEATRTLKITGSLTLDGENNPNAVFIFQTDSTLVTASASRVALINGAQPCNVFWRVGSSATLGSDSTFVGTILANASISLENAVNVNGRLLARTGQVSLINDVITMTRCSTPGSSSTTSSTTSTTSSTNETTSSTNDTTPVTTRATGSTGTGTSGAAGTPVPGGASSDSTGALGSGGSSGTTTGAGAGSGGGGASATSGGTATGIGRTTRGGPGGGTSTATSRLAETGPSGEVAMAVAGALLLALGIALSIASDRSHVSGGR